VAASLVSVSARCLAEVTSASACTLAVATVFSALSVAAERVSGPMEIVGLTKALRQLVEIGRDLVGGVPPLDQRERPGLDLLGHDFHEHLRAEWVDRRSDSQTSLPLGAAQARERRSPMGARPGLGDN
jgi:hypothetical protein